MRVVASLWCTYMLLVLPVGAQGSSKPQADSAFLLQALDVRRSPSPFIGNGRIGVIIPALGIGASQSFKAGLYEHSPEDVPRIVAIPAWNDVAVFDGSEAIGTKAVPDSSHGAYCQVVDMRTGTARTLYDW